MKWAGIALLSLAVSLALGAFGTHSLRGLLSEDMLATFKTGVQYQQLISVGLLACSLLEKRIAKPSLPMALLAWGMVLFSGSLYALALTGHRNWGAVTPLGGALMIVGCVWLGACALRSEGQKKSSND
ncbi:MAG: DUF423 domain-containing protein [Armatimonadetes bacterium]|nr:DUF423 domain-containing protein [Armatimonadota bacterium]